MAAYESVENLMLQINMTKPGKEGVLAIILDAASRGIDRFCNRPDGFNADDDGVARIYRGSGRNWQNIDECVVVELVEVKESVNNTAYVAWAATDWIPASGDPTDPDYNSLPVDMLVIDPTGDRGWFTGPRSTQDIAFRATELPGSPRDEYRSRRAEAPTVRVTARWGYALTTPDSIRQACAMQAAKWFKRLEGSMASALANTDLGTIEMFRTLDPDVEFLLSLGRYIKPAIGRR